jgi:hypothetical protein
MNWLNTSVLNYMTFIITIKLGCCRHHIIYLSTGVVFIKMHLHEEGYDVFNWKQKASHEN